MLRHLVACGVAGLLSLSAGSTDCSIRGLIRTSHPVVEAQAFLIGPGPQPGLNFQTLPVSEFRFRSRIPAGTFRLLVLRAPGHKVLVIPVLGDQADLSLDIHLPSLEGPWSGSLVNDPRTERWTRLLQEWMGDPRTQGANFMIPLRLIWERGMVSSREADRETIQRLAGEILLERDPPTRQFRMVVLLTLLPGRQALDHPEVAKAMDQELLGSSPFWALAPQDLLWGVGWRGAGPGGVPGMDMKALRARVMSDNPDPDVRSALRFIEFEASVMRGSREDAERSLLEMEASGADSKWIEEGRRRFARFPLREGDSFPAFKARGLQGGWFTQGDLPPGVVVIHVWNDWLLRHSDEVEVLDRLRSLFMDAGVSFVGLKVGVPSGGASTGGRGSAETTVPWTKGELLGGPEDPLVVSLGRRFPAVLLLGPDRKVRFQTTSRESLGQLEGALRKVIQNAGPAVNTPTLK